VGQGGGGFFRVEKTRIHFLAKERESVRKDFKNLGIKNNFLCNIRLWMTFVFIFVFSVPFKYSTLGI
jgi:hypothetical protein